MAVHVLAFLARRRGEAVTSDTIAGSVNTTPVVVRRLMGSLRNAGLVQVQPGARGGAQLAREPHDITVLDVYHAVEEKPDLFALHAEPRGDCDIGGNIRGVLRGVFCRAHEAMQRELGAVTIADVFHDVTGRSCCGPRPAGVECGQPRGDAVYDGPRKATI